MALDARKRQQKLAKKAAKRKAVLATKKPVWSVGGLVPHGRQTMPVASAPIHECLIPESLFDIGIGNVVPPHLTVVPAPLRNETFERM